MPTSSKYSDMQDSGIEWIGCIPIGWNVSKIGSLYTLRNEKVSDKDYPPLSVTMKGILPQLSNAAKTDDGDNRKLVRVGDFVINSRSDRRGSCGISPYDGSVSLINTVLTPNDTMNAGYYGWLFHTSLFSDEFYKWGYGIVDDLWTTTWSEMKRIFVPVPPYKEQEVISVFLDEQCRKIDEMLAATVASIEDYSQWRTSIINETVTRGLEKDIKFNRVDLGWIDEIPDGWETKRLKDAFSFGKGLPITKADLVEVGVPVISYGQIHSKMNTGTHLSDELLRYVQKEYLDSHPSSILSEGDIVIADTSEDLNGLGNAVLMDRQNKVFAGYHTIILHPEDAKITKFLSYLFKSETFRLQLRTAASGIKVFSVTQRMLRACTIILPPEKTRNIITGFLDEQCSAIDEIIAEKELLIKELEAYKQSLIYEVVTGKRKVV